MHACYNTTTKKINVSSPFELPLCSPSPLAADAARKGGPRLAFPSRPARRVFLAAIVEGSVRIVKARKISDKNQKCEEEYSLRDKLQQKKQRRI